MRAPALFYWLTPILLPALALAGLIGFYSLPLSSPKRFWGLTNLALNMLTLPYFFYAALSLLLSGRLSLVNQRRYYWLSPLVFLLVYILFNLILGLAIGASPSSAARQALSDLISTDHIPFTLQGLSIAYGISATLALTHQRIISYSRQPA